MISFKALPAKEAIEFFRQKGYAISFSWEDVWQSGHQAAFTVAKAMQLDILRDIRTAVDTVMSDGTTFETFRKNLKPRLLEKGWWGKAEMTDPLTGETKLVQLGSTRRLRTIFDTNLRTAHSEGQWARIQEAKKSFPYLRYNANNSEHPRLEHSGWDDLVLPADDPFWQAHFPVKAWGCKCNVTQMNARMLEQSGLKVGESPKVPEYTYTNKRTGEIQKIPAGVHPAFNYPPGGRLANMPKFLADKLVAVPADIGAQWVAVTAGIGGASGIIYTPYRMMAQNALAKEDRKGEGITSVAHVLSPATVRDLAAMDQTPVVLETAAVLIKDQELLHALRPLKDGLGKTLPENVWINLPDYLTAAEIYYDRLDPGILYAFDVENRLGKVVVRINYKDKTKSADGARKKLVANFVSTGGIIDARNLKEKMPGDDNVLRYKLLRN